MVFLMVDFGFCNIDGLDCYGKGCICRLNKKAGFQSDYNYSNPQVRVPFRNKFCCHFGELESVSGYVFYSDVDMSGYIPLVKRFWCPYSDSHKRCLNVKLNCHDCTRFHAPHKRECLEAFF
jgi:hypothetical protein